MKPYFETANGVLYNCDCLEIMPELEPVDLCLTDPPYGIDYQSGRRNIKHDKITYDDNLNWLDLFFKLIEPLFKGHAYFFTPYQKIDVFIYNCKKYLPYKNLLIWEKNNIGMGDLNGDYAPKYEPIIFCSDGLKLNGSRDPNIIKATRTNNDLHPTQKPLTLINYLIGKSTQKNNVVFDPFIGSGTTAIACEELNRKWIGIEISEKYCEIAAKRIEAETKQLRLF